GRGEGDPTDARDALQCLPQPEVFHRWRGQQSVFRSRPFAVQLAGQPLRVLDVAAGHGLFGITIAERHPEAHVTALDWPNVLAVAGENARRARLARRDALRPR